ncbi:MAG: hypothetical protein OXD41_02075 [Thaumarchaeota archaeon]|nr:hypothetical protein [Nitrososphaerota archaeon]
MRAESMPWENSSKSAQCREASGELPGRPIPSRYPTMLLVTSSLPCPRESWASLKSDSLS